SRITDDVGSPCGRVLGAATEVVADLPPTIRAARVVGGKCDYYLHPPVVEVVGGTGGVELAGTRRRIVVRRVERHPILIDSLASVQPARAELGAARTEDLHNVAHVVLGVSGIEQFDDERLAGIRLGYLGEPELRAGTAEVVVQRHVAEPVDLAVGGPDRVSVEPGIVRPRRLF